MKYLVVVERGEETWGAHVPDLPGCIAVGESRQAVLELIAQAMSLHCEGLRETGEAIPEPCCEGEVVEVDAV